MTGMVAACIKSHYTHSSGCIGHACAQAISNAQAIRYTVRAGSGLAEGLRVM